MAKLILNSTVEVEISAFNKSVSVYDNQVTSTAYVRVENSAGDLETLLGTTITALVIKNSKNEVIYNLENITANISSLNITLSGDTIGTDLNLTF